MRGVRRGVVVDDSGEAAAVSGGSQSRDGADPGAVVQRVQSGVRVGEGQSAPAAGVAGVSAAVASVGRLTDADVAHLRDVAAISAGLKDAAAALTAAQVREARREVKALGEGTGLTAHEVQTVLYCYHTRQLTKRQIATRLFLPLARVTEILLRHTDDTILADQILISSASQMATRFVAEATPKELLQALKRIKTPGGKRLLGSERDPAPVEGPKVLLGVKVEFAD